MPGVVVVGAGVVGCAVARELAPDVDVTVLDRGEVGGGTTARSAGLVTMTPAYSDEPAVAAHATEFFEGRDEFIPQESLELVPPKREGEARRRVERLAESGLDVAFLDRERVRASFPGIGDDWCGAVRHTETGYVDAVALTESLATEAAARGAQFQTGTTVTDLRVADGVVAGVETDAGIRPADAVVVAAGWRTPGLLEAHLPLPVRPYRTQCAVFRPDDPLPEGFSIGAVPEERVYFRPAGDGALLVGGWAHAVTDPAGASRGSDAEFCEHAREVAAGLVGSVGDRVDEWAGVDCGTPDARPVIDAPVAGPEGLVVATGFHGRGVMTAPVAATAVRSFLVNEPAPFPLGLFRHDRFDDPSPDFEFFSIPEKR